MKFNKMTKSFKNAPEIFQRGMAMILKGLLNDKYVVYMNDVLVYDKTKAEHDKNLEESQIRVKEYGLIINKELSIYCEKDADFLNYIIIKNLNKLKLDKKRKLLISLNLLQ